MIPPKTKSYPLGQKQTYLHVNFPVIETRKKVKATVM